MLTDNALEISFHHLALDKQAEIMWRAPNNPYEYTDALNDAVRRHFDAKVRFMKNLKIINDEEAVTINIFHGFRNEVYHIGLQHERVLPTISRFYLKVASDILSRQSLASLTYGVGLKPPDRVAKYFKNVNSVFPPLPSEYFDACSQISKKIVFEAAELAVALAEHMEELIDETDISLDTLSRDTPNPCTRDEVIVRCLAWKAAATDEAKEFARLNGCQVQGGFAYVDWIAKNYKLPIKKDPIENWRKRKDRLRLEENPHKALKLYRNFIDETVEIRNEIADSHAAFDRYIDGLIDERRGK